MSIFSKIEQTKIPSNTFDLTHDKKLSGKMGKLIPTMLVDLVPGDQVTLDSSVMVRMAPLIAPVMHQISCYMHYFFVPNRIIWPNWEKFITGGESGVDVVVPPKITFPTAVNAVKDGSLADYMGLPSRNVSLPGNITPRTVSALPFAAYRKIYNEYYRDQNLIEKLDDELTDGESSTNFNMLAPLLNRAWQHDYFTASLPFTQKGPAVTIPLGGEAPLFFKYPNINPNPGADEVTDANTGALLTGNIDSFQGGLRTAGANIPANINVTKTHFADLSQATASTITDLRRAFKLQEWLEKNARGGTRYIESIAVHFGVQSSDKRLQRPEFIGGYRTPIKISEVLQTSGAFEDIATTPQATMAGHAIGLGGTGKMSYYAEEHGYIVGIMSIMPRSAYQQGIPRHFLRFDKFDYYWPEFAHIGEQPVQNQEIFQEQGSDGTETFGYTPRYAEYKYHPSTVHGDFRNTLDFWHMGRKFATQPALNQDFIEMDYNEVDRIFAVQDDSDHLWCHVLNNVKATRKMPVFGTPKIM